ncbi:unnamed protein product, partial [Porites lobata]
MEKVKASGVAGVEAAVNQRNLKRKHWKKRVMTWTWLKKKDLKSSTEALICAAQEQALRTNYANLNTDESVESPLCLMCHERGE